jgi:cysteine desulfurase
MSKRVYLDFASATPLDKKVKKSMEPFMAELYANPSSPHSAGREQREVLEEARSSIASQLGAKPAEIIFTSGSTEGINLAIGGVAAKFPQGRIAITAIEHEAVRQTAENLETPTRVVRVITVGESGVVDLEQVKAVIDDQTVLLAVQYVNHEIGTIQPIGKIGNLVNEIRLDRENRGITLPLYLFCDAAQAGYLGLGVSRLGVDMMTMGGSKLYGPAGSGFLYVRTGVELEPVLFGGGQENGIRSGTQNVGGAVGLAKALEIMQSERVAESKRQKGLSDWLWSELRKNIEDVKLNGDRTQRIAGNINFTIDGADGETLLAYLDKSGFMVATGSACTAGSELPSAVLRAIGRSNQEADSSLRLSFGRTTTKAQLVALVKAMHKDVARVRELKLDSRSKKQVQ